MLELAVLPVKLLFEESVRRMPVFEFAVALLLLKSLTFEAFR